MALGGAYGRLQGAGSTGGGRESRSGGLCGVLQGREHQAGTSRLRAAESVCVSVCESVCVCVRACVSLCVSVSVYPSSGSSQPKGQVGKGEE